MLKSKERWAICNKVWWEIIPHKRCINKERIPIRIYTTGEHIQTKAFSSSNWAIERQVATESEAVLIFDNLIYLAAWQSLLNRWYVGQALSNNPRDAASIFCPIWHHKSISQPSSELSLTALWILSNEATILVHKSPGVDVPVRCCIYPCSLVPGAVPGNKANIHASSVSADWGCEMLWWIVQQCAHSMTALKWSLPPSTWNLLCSSKADPPLTNW